MGNAGYPYYLVEMVQVTLNDMGVRHRLEVHERTEKGRKQYRLIVRMQDGLVMQVSEWSNRSQFTKIMEGITGVIAAVYTGSPAGTVPRLG